MDYSYKNIWLINFPVMMSILIEQLINITDAIFLGHVGEIELGASALAGIWYLAIYMLGFGFSLGLQVVIARRNGERKYTETGNAFYQGLLFLTGLAALLCVVSNIFSPMILKHLIASEKVYSAVIIYLDWRTWGLLFSFPFLAARSFLVGITLTKPLNAAAFTAVLVNILFNWILIFHFNMGIAGSAIASSFAELCSLVVLAMHILRKMNKKVYGLQWKFDSKSFRHVCSVSVWTMFNPFIGVAAWFAFFVAIEHLGESELAATNVIRSISTFFFVIVNSLAATSGSLVSNLLGAGERDEVIPLCNRVIRLGYAVGMPLIILTLICFNPLFKIYSDSESLMQIARIPFTVALLNYAFALPGYVYLNAVTGTGATQKSFIFQAVTIVAYLLYLWKMSTYNASLPVYWSAEYLYVIMLASLSFIYLKYKKY